MSSRPDLRDLRMMQEPNEWPMWPYLPLKRYKEKGHAPECGFLYAEDKPTIYIHPMYSVKQGTRLKDLPHKKYLDFNAIIDDGWMVD